MSNQKNKPGAVIIIADSTRSRFLLQRKDDTHPIVACRGCISLFGGSRESGEDARTALERELSEELRLEGIFLVPIAWRDFQLAGNQFEGSYELAVFTCELGNHDFDEFARQIKLPGVVLEGIGEVMERADLVELLEDTNHFVASLDVVFREFLGEAVKTNITRLKRREPHATINLTHNATRQRLRRSDFLLYGEIKFRSIRRYSFTGTG